MHGILGAIGTMYRTKGLGRLSPCDLCVGGANHCAPCLDGALTNELHTNDYIALDERLKICEERFASVLSVKCFAG